MYVLECEPDAEDLSDLGLDTDLEESGGASTDTEGSPGMVGFGVGMVVVGFGVNMAMVVVGFGVNM